MTDKQEHRTTGTARRGAHQMSGRGLVFHVADEIRSLRHDLEHTSGGRAAKTLAKTEGLRVTLNSAEMKLAQMFKLQSQRNGKIVDLEKPMTAPICGQCPAQNRPVS